MSIDRNTWRAVRWPLLVIAAAGITIVAAVLNRTTAREWALTVGGPALTVLLPAGLLWLLVAIVWCAVRRTPAARTIPLKLSRC